MAGTAYRGYHRGSRFGRINLLHQQCHIMERYPVLRHIKDHDRLIGMHAQVVQKIHRRMGTEIAGISAREVHISVPDQAIKCTGIRRRT